MIGTSQPSACVDLHLPRGVGQVVVAADDVGDAHVVVVDDDREHVGRIAVRAQQHQVVELLVGEDDLALHLVVDDRLAVLARAQADRRLDARRRLRGVAVAPAPVVAHRLAFGARLGAHLLELLLARVAAIGAARGEHLLDDLAVAVGARELADRLAVPSQPEPGEPVEDRLDRRFGRAFAVGVLDPSRNLPPRRLA